jgi:hypothetical protein
MPFRVWETPLLGLGQRLARPQASLAARIMTVIEITELQEMPRTMRCIDIKRHQTTPNADHGTSR